MIKVDYILLLRHFRGETTEVENYRILFWKEQHIVNSLTYRRLQKISQTIKEDDYSSHEIKIWHDIIVKIVAE